MVKFIPWKKVLASLVEQMPIVGVLANCGLSSWWVRCGEAVWLEVSGGVPPPDRTRWLAQKRAEC